MQNQIALDRRLLRGEALEDRRLLSIDALAIPSWVAQGPAPQTNGYTLGLTDGAGNLINPVAGAIQAIAVDPSDTQTVYVGAVNGGIWKSTHAKGDDNANIHWTPQTDAFSSLSISALAFDPSDPTHNTLYAGTGNTASGAFGTGFFRGEGDVGLLRTIDGGSHWQLISKWFFQDPVRIVNIVPIPNAAGGTRLLVATDNYQFNAAGALINSTTSRAGVLISDDPLDAAPVFHFVPAAQLPSGSVTDLVSDPTNPQQLYAALYGQGIYQSPDGGNTWTQATAGIAATDLTPTTAIKLAVSGAAGSPVYAAMLQDTTGKAIYQAGNIYSSVDAGAHWVVMAAPPAPLATDAFSNAYSHFSMAADPTNPALVYISGAPTHDTNTSPFYGVILMGNVGARTAGAGNWTSIVQNGASANPLDPLAPVPSAPHPDSRRMLFDATGQIWEADDGGLYRLVSPSNALNRRWVSANGDLQITELMSVAYDPVTNLLLGGAQDNDSAAQTSPGGTTWQILPSGGGDGQIVQAQTAPPGDPAAVYEYYSAQFLGHFSQRLVIADGTIKAPTQPSLKVTNPANPALAGLPLSHSIKVAGQTVHDVDPNLQFKTPYAVNPLDPKRLLFGTDSVYESLDGGQTLARYTLATTGISFINAVAYGGRVPEPTSPGGFTNLPDVAYVASGSSLFFRLSAGGTFTQTNYGKAGTASATAAAVEDIAVDPDDYRTVYILDAKGHVWRTTDTGKTVWTDLTNNLFLPKNLSLDTIELVKSGGNVALLVGGGGGVYRAINPSPGGDAEWTKYGTGLPNATVTDIRYAAANDVLAVGTDGRGAWLISNASATLFADPVLHITATDQVDNILIRRDQDHPESVDVFINNSTSTPDVSTPMAALRQIVIDAAGGVNTTYTLTVDSANGPVSVPDGITFHGGLGVNTVTLTGLAPIQKNIPQPDANGAGSAALEGSDPLGFGPQLEDVTYTNVQTGNVFDNMASPLSKKMTSIGGGLQKTAELLRDQNAIGTQVASLGGSLRAALEGASGFTIPPVSDPVAADPDSQPTQSAGVSLLARLIESGDGGFNLSAIEDAAEDGSISTPEDLLAALQTLGGSSGNVTLTQNGDFALYDFKMTKTLSGQANLDVLGQALGGTIQLSGDLDLSADVAVHLQFGVDDNGFFIESNAPGDPLFAVSNIHLGGAIAGAGRLGILGVDLTEGTLVVDPAVTLQLSLNQPPNPPADGLLRLSDLESEGDSLLSATLTGGSSHQDVVLDGTFSVAAIEGGQGQPFSLASAEVTLTWPDVSNPTQFSVSAQSSAGQDLLNFLHGAPQDLLNGLNKVGDFLDQYRNQPVFATQIPFTHGTTLGQVLDYGDAFRRKATALLAAADGTASFTTLQDLAVKLADSLGIDLAALGLQYDSSTKSLTYHVDFSQSLAELTLPVDFSVHAGSLADFSTTSQLAVTPQVDVSFDVGLDLSALVTSDKLTQAFFISNAQLDGTVSAAVNPLDADAHIGSIHLHVIGGLLSASGAISLALVDPATNNAGGRLTLDELAGALTSPNSIIGGSSITDSGSFSLPVTADPFVLGGATVALSGLVSGTDQSIDYSLEADLSGEIVAGVAFVNLPSGKPSNVTLSKTNGLTVDAKLTVAGVPLTTQGPITTDGDFTLHVVGDPFNLGGVTVALVGDLSRTSGVIDYSLEADLSGEIVAGVAFVNLPSGKPSNVTLSKTNGLTVDAKLTVAGVRLAVSGAITATDDFTLQAAADPFELGGVTVALVGNLTRANGNIGYSFNANVTGTLLPGLKLEEVSAGVPSSVSLTSANGLVIKARAEAFGIDFNVAGRFQATDSFTLVVSTDPFNIPGNGTVALAGSVFRNAAGLDWSLTAHVQNWRPVAFLTVPDLVVSLNSAGLVFDARVDIAGVHGIQLHGDYDFDQETYLITAGAPVDWHLIDGVDMTQVIFSVSNRAPDGTAGDTTVGARAKVRLFGTDFNVVANVAAAGAWIAATPADPASFNPVPGLTLADETVVASSYDFVLDLDKLSEVAQPPSPLTHRQRQISEGINLVATSQLPPDIPVFGGSEVEVQGVIGTSLAAMSIEAKIVLEHPLVLVDVLEFDALGLRITGTPSLTVFGQGKILHDKIPGLNEDILLEAGLSLTAGGIQGSLSLLAPVHDLFGVSGLDIIESDVSVGLTAGFPVTVGLNFVVNVPQFAQDLLDLPAHLGAALNESSTNPILSMTVENWRPFHIIGLDNVLVKEGTLVVAPDGGMIGTKVFQPGFSATFDADILGTTVHFLGLFNQQTKGVLLESYVSEFSLAGLKVTGAGPDGKYEDGVVSSPSDPDADNGAYFKAAFTADEKHLTFSSLFDLPGITAGGRHDTAELDGDIGASGVTVNGTINHWRPLGNTVEFDGKLHAAISFQTTSLNLDFDVKTSLLGSSVDFAGSLFVSADEYDIAASATIALKFPSGPHVADLIGTIAVGKHTPFAIGLAGDVSLPGSRPGLVELAGAIGASGVSVFGDVNHWQLVPGLSFDGTANIDVDMQASTLLLQLDVNADVLGSNLNLSGNVVASAGKLDLDLHGHVVFDGKRVGFGRLSLDAAIVTKTDASGARSYAISFDGDIAILNAFDLRAHADLVTASDGGFKFVATVFVDAGLDSHGNPIPIRLLDFDIPGIARITADFQASATITFGSNLDDFSLSAHGKVAAKAHMHISGISDPSISVNFDVPIDLGVIKVPHAQIVIDTKTVSAPKWLGGGSVTVATGFHMAELDVPWGHAADPATTVTAKVVRTSLIPGAPGMLQIRGGDGPERLVVNRIVSILSRPGLPPLSIDLISVSGANGNGDLVTLLSVPTSQIAGVDVDMGGGNDRVNISQLITLPATIRGGGGDDEIHGGGGPNTIYGGNGPAMAQSNAAVAAAGIGGIGGIHFPPPIVFTNPILTDRGDELYGGPGNDRIFGEDGNDLIVGGGGNDTIDGGPGVNVINGVLLWTGTDLPERLQVIRQLSDTDDNIVLRLVNRLGTPSTFFSMPTANLTGLNLDAGGGDDQIDVSPLIDLPATISGGAGNDTIQGGSGPNLIHGGDGNDVLFGGAGNDSIFGEAGDDVLLGNGGTDLLDGGPGDNLILDPGAAPPGANQPPTVTPVADQTVEEGHLLSFTVSASDASLQTPAPAGTIYSAAGDFSALQNPDGPWSYGWSTSTGSAFHSYPIHGAPGAAVAFWNEPSILQLGAPAVFFNATGSVQRPSTNVLQPHQLAFHPGANGENSIVRWTAPAAGTYVVEGSFGGIDSTTTDVHVLADFGGAEENELFSDRIDGFGDVKRFLLTVTINAGDHVDFTVGTSGNGFFSDSTALDATIAPLAATFSAARQFSESANPNGAWTYGWANQPGADFHPLSAALVSAAAPVVGWSGGPNDSALPIVYHNPTADNQSPSDLGHDPHVAPGQLAIRGGDDSIAGVVRWTAPAAGDYLVIADFTSLDSDPSADVFVHRGTTQLFTATLKNSAEVYEARFQQVVAMRAGETLDFSVSGDDYVASTSGLDATIVPLESAPFSAAGQFSDTLNPNGRWSYGTASGLEQPFEPLTSQYADPSGAITGWTMSSLSTPTVIHNGTGAVGTDPNFNDEENQGIAPGQLVLRLVEERQRPAIVRWTAPADGNYDVSAAFLEIGEGSDTDVYVLHGSEQLFAGNVNSNVDHTQASYAATIRVLAGETIDFVAVAAPADAFAGSTALDATITLHDGGGAPPTPQQLTFSLEPGAPAGASIDPDTGVFTWTPSNEQGPGVYTLGIRVIDDGTPPLDVIKSFTIAVTEQNHAPALAAIADQSLSQFDLLALSASATDQDLPANTLSFSLDNPPAGAQIDAATGALRWRPDASTLPGDYTITVRVTDDGAVPLHATSLFQVEVLPAPVVNSVPPQHGEVSVDANGAVSFQPSASFEHVDSFDFTVVDGLGQTDAGTARFVSPEFAAASKLYDKVLSRAASDAEVLFWAKQLNNPGDQADLASAFLDSDEHRVAVVTSIYQEFLGRAPDAFGLQIWVSAMRGGLSAELVQASVLASDEFFRLHGATNSDFVQALYQDLFRRTASAAESGFWLAALERGVDRFTVARGFISSSEYRAELIQRFYADYLDRQVDGAGLKHWVDQLANGVSLETVQLAMITSDEFNGLQRVRA